MDGVLELAAKEWRARFRVEGGTAHVESLRSGYRPRDLATNEEAALDVHREFTAAFAARLDSLCEIAVREAQNNARVVPGRALIAPGDIERMVICDTAEEVVDAIFGFYANRALTPTASERELMLYL